MSIRLATNALHIKDGESYDTIDVLRGAKGETGTTPDLTIGTVTTGAPGTSASATITGTDEDPVLNRTILEVTQEQLMSTLNYPLHQQILFRIK